MIKYLINYFQFFSRIPINYRIEDPINVFKEGVTFLGVYGLVYGTIPALVYFILRLRIDVIEAWPLILLLDVILTGAFHHDAFADTMDGLFSGRSKERKLEIMKDSRIGTNGAVALILYYIIILIMGVKQLNEVNSIKDEILFILSFFMISRSAMTLTFRDVVYKSSSQEGLGNILIGISTTKLVTAQIIALVYISLIYGYTGAIIYCIVIIVIESYRRFIYKEIGGINGDTSGAAVLISQMVWLIARAIII
ncbi:adenosylcobinamide-GDP ribazoletransferase [Fundicoccus culcitae]|uniref:Adenosylcobinamide-GDP ribazoletransferase n=1 Tax=Fundicoccus culcitae TaxID=2969821 RepID=A0ABY5P3U9_9LACT|nr:adenosylcobinamide-GDP ribazoletransferase [Fundicoccus culcitae]UUX33349.1 adenosylcobinamide-GDP ribazoletransferase [Fundicoccus culcitae]